MEEINSKKESVIFSILMYTYLWILVIIVILGKYEGRRFPSKKLVTGYIY